MGTRKYVGYALENKMEVVASNEYKQHNNNNNFYVKVGITKNIISKERKIGILS